MSRAQVSRAAMALRWSGALLGCLLGAGCLGYQVGTGPRPEYRTIAVPVFRNRSLAPQMEVQVTNAIIKRLQANGTLRVQSVAEADAVVTGEITNYHRRPLRYEQNDTNVPREYRVTITATVEVKDRQGRVLLKSTTFEGRADTFIGTDLQTADFQALPLAADDLARQVVTMLAERW